MQPKLTDKRILQLENEFNAKLNKEAQLNLKLNKILKQQQLSDQELMESDIMLRGINKELYNKLETVVHNIETLKKLLTSIDTNCNNSTTILDTLKELQEESQIDADLLGKNIFLSNIVGSEFNSKSTSVNYSQVIRLRAALSEERKRAYQQALKEAREVL